MNFPAARLLVLETLSDLSAMYIVDKGSVYQFIQSLYIPENGGFGPEPGLGTTPPSTFHAVLCLEKLGKLKYEARIRQKSPRPSSPSALTTAIFYCIIIKTVISGGTHACGKTDPTRED